MSQFIVDFTQITKCDALLSQLRGSRCVRQARESCWPIVSKFNETQVRARAGQHAWPFALTACVATVAHFPHSRAAGKPFEQLLREIIDKVTAIVDNVQRGDSVFNIATLYCYFNQ